MSEYLSSEDMAQLKPAAQAFRSPIPTQVVSNGEFMPAPQSARQREVQGRIEEAAKRLSGRHGLDRRAFLGSAAGMACAFAVMNEVYGSLFGCDSAEAAEPGAAAARADALGSQFIVDLHYPLHSR